MLINAIFVKSKAVLALYLRTYSSYIFYMTINLLSISPYGMRCCCQNVLLQKLIVLKKRDLWSVWCLLHLTFLLLLEAEKIIHVLLYLSSDQPCLCVNTLKPSL